MSGSAVRQSVVYLGRDLEAMLSAVNYHRWVLQIFKPYLGTRLVEVGAGTGSFSELLLENNTQSLSLVEPSAAMYNTLNERIKQLNTPAQIRAYNTTFAEVADRIKLTQQPDSIVYVNVLEHIPDDEAELNIVRQALGDSGRVFIFVPALPWLFGSFDKQLGHLRRYTRSELEDKCRRAGFKIIESRYLDLAGILPWWVKYCLLQSNTMGPSMVKFYDKYVVPGSKVVESIIEPPVGKNIVLIAEKI